MKKKVSMLLAAILLATPLNAFAAGTTSLDRSPTLVPEKTLFAETYTNNTVQNITGTKDDDEVKNIVSAPILTVDLKNDIKKGDRFTIELENSHWYFRNNNDDSIASAADRSNDLTIKGMRRERPYSNAALKEINDRLVNFNSATATANPGQIMGSDSKYYVDPSIISAAATAAAGTNVEPTNVARFLGMYADSNADQAKLYEIRMLALDVLNTANFSSSQRIAFINEVNKIIQAPASIPGPTVQPPNSSWLVETDANKTIVKDAIATAKSAVASAKTHIWGASPARITLANATAIPSPVPPVPSSLLEIAAEIVNYGKEDTSGANVAASTATGGAAVTFIQERIDAFNIALRAARAEAATAMKEAEKALKAYNENRAAFGGIPAAAGNPFFDTHALAADLSRRLDNLAEITQATLPAAGGGLTGAAVVAIKAAATTAEIAVTALNYPANPTATSNITAANITAAVGVAINAAGSGATILNYLDQKINGTSVPTAANVDAAKPNAMPNTINTDVAAGAIDFPAPTVSTGNTTPSTVADASKAVTDAITNATANPGTPIDLAGNTNYNAMLKAMKDILAGNTTVPSTGFGDTLAEFGPNWFDAGYSIWVDAAAKQNAPKWNPKKHDVPTTKSLYDDGIRSFAGNSNSYLREYTYENAVKDSDINRPTDGKLQDGGIWYRGDTLETNKGYQVGGLYVRTEASILVPTYSKNKIDMMHRTATMAGFGGEGNYQASLQSAFSGRQTLPYILEVSNGNDKVATITFLQDVINVRDFVLGSSNALSIEVPLVTLTKDKSDVRVKLTSSLSSITSTTINLASASGSQTEAVIANAPVTGRNNLKFDININEKRLMSFKDTVGSTATGVRGVVTPWGPVVDINPARSRFFTLIAPDDFEFVFEADANYGTYFLGDPTLVPFFPYEDNNTNRLRKNILVVAISDLNRTVGSSSNTLGSLYLKNLVLRADDDAPWGEVKLQIKDGDYSDNYKDTAVTRKAGVTNQDLIKGLERADWKINFRTTTTVPTLVNGRYDRVSSQSPKDEDHKAAKISFAENATHSWWAERQTIFELSNGAKFRKIKIDNAKNFQTRTGTTSANDVLKNDYSIQDNIVSTSVTGNATNNADNKKRKYEYVTIEQNRFLIEEIYIKKDAKASFDLEVWLSIESGFEGDVTLVPKGTGLPADAGITPLVIAKSVNPIKIDTKVTDVRIGYQGESTADFTITETDKGRLQKDKTVEIKIDDDIADDYIYFAHQDSNPIKIEVDGDLKIRDVKLNAGKVTFVIDRASTKASAIKVSNVKVKVDRGVPESNLHPYKIVVGGSAVAANSMYDYLQQVDETRARERKFDNFTTKGLKANYINIVTSATGSTGTYTNVVKVTVGESKVIVGTNKELDMDTAAFIDDQSQSIMVPVRFVSVALGIDEDLIVWNEINRTVTIYGNKTVKFTIGSDIITVDGVESQMTTGSFIVKAVIRDDRSFLPFRALGNALGISVTWNAETRTATYNAEHEKTAA